MSKYLSPQHERSMKKCDALARAGKAEINKRRKRPKQKADHTDGRYEMFYTATRKV